MPSHGLLPPRATALLLLAITAASQDAFALPLRDTGDSSRNSDYGLPVAEFLLGGYPENGGAGGPLDSEASATNGEAVGFALQRILRGWNSPSQRGMSLADSRWYPRPGRRLFRPSGRSTIDAFGKRNIDEIDRTAFDGFFKRNAEWPNRAAWVSYLDSLDDPLEDPRP